MKLKIRGILFFLLICSMAGAVEQNQSEQNTPKKNQKHLSIGVSPFMPLIRSFKGKIEIGASQQWTVGPELTYWGTFNYGKFSSGYLGTVSLGLKYYLSGAVFQDSWYLKFSPGVYQYRERNRVTNTTDKGFQYSNTAGYHFFWQNGFNIELGLGWGLVNALDAWIPFPEAEINVGWAF